MDFSRFAFAQNRPRRSLDLDHLSTKSWLFNDPLGYKGYIDQFNNITRCNNLGIIPKALSKGL